MLSFEFRGPSVGADEMMRVGRSLGLNIYTSPREIPKQSDRSTGIRCAL